MVSAFEMTWIVSGGALNSTYALTLHMVESFDVPYDDSELSVNYFRCWVFTVLYFPTQCLDLKHIGLHSKIFVNIV